MSIQTTLTVTLAEVEVSDQCTVTLTTRSRLTDLAPDEAVQLAGELIEAAKEADAAIRDDLAQRRVVHGFDVDLPPLGECAWCGHGPHLGQQCSDVATVGDRCACDLRSVAS